MRTGRNKKKKKEPCRDGKRKRDRTQLMKKSSPEVLEDSFLFPFGYILLCVYSIYILRNKYYIYCVYAYMCGGGSCECMYHK